MLEFAKSMGLSKVKFLKNPKKKSTTAIVTGTENDAIAKVLKRFCSQTRYKVPLDINLNFEFEAYPLDSEVYFHTLHLSEALMSDKYTGTVKCHEPDEFDKSTGEKEAFNKAVSNYKSAFERALKRWQVAMLKSVREVSPETFESAVAEVSKN